MTHQEIRKKFLDFFERNGHKIMPSSSLIPSDPSVLFTTAGMQQFKPYYTNPELAPAKNVASIQKSLRTSDIDQVGDQSHLTFFEMMGNFSFGGYGKEEAIKLAYKFITKDLGLKIEFVSIYGKGLGMPIDNDSEKIWNSIDPNIEVKKMGVDNNTWGPTGLEGPCGPTTEIYVNGVEIWNIVFNEFYYKGNREQLLKETDSGKFEKLRIPGVDTGMGLERLSAVVNGKSNVFETDLFESIFELLPDELNIVKKRILADHGRAIVFLISDDVIPSNKDRGYVLRKLIRRIVTHSYLYNQSKNRKGEGFDIRILIPKVIEIYKDVYEELDKEKVLDVFELELAKFTKTINEGIKEFDKRIMSREPQDRFGRIGSFHDQKVLYGSDAFYLFQSFGFPKEVMKDLTENAGGSFDEEGFEYELKEHRKKSRAGVEKKFGK